MKNLLVIGLLLFMVYSAYNGIRIMNGSGDDGLAKGIVDSINSTAPKMVDQDIRLDGAKLDNGKILVTYTIVTASRNDLDANEFNAYVSNQAQSWICNDRTLKKIVDDGMVFVAKYRDQFKNPFTSVEMSKNLCRGI